MRNPKSISRRKFLQTLGVGAAGAAAVAAGIPGRLPGAPALVRAQTSVVLKTAGWPYDAYPEKEPEGGYTGYHKALEKFLKDNPDITMERIEANIWSGNALRTAISGGTAPSFYPSGSVGNWWATGIQTAFTNGLMADITDLYAKFNIDSKISELAKAGRAVFTIKGADGVRVHGLPVEINPGSGLFFRRDLIAKTGLKEPNNETTWAEMRELAKALTSSTMKGFGMDGGTLEWIIIGSDPVGMGRMFSQIPDPKSSWRRRLDLTSPRVLEMFQNSVGTYRAMMFEDQSIQTDPTQKDIHAAGFNQQVAMFVTPGLFYTRTGEPNPIALAEKLGQPMEDTWGFVVIPRGLNGSYNFASSASTIGLAFSPDLTPAELEAAFRLYDFMEIGEGFDIRRQYDYEKGGKNLKLAYGGYPWPRAKQTIDNVPGSPDEAWGEYAKTVSYIAGKTSTAPDSTLYYPIEGNTGPTNDAYNDAISKFMYEPGTLDVPAILKSAEETWNTQAQGFSSSIPEADFVAAATAFYADYGKYLETSFPEYYASTFKPFFDDTIKPSLGL